MRSQRDGHGLRDFSHGMPWLSLAAHQPPMVLPWPRSSASGWVSIEVQGEVPNLAGITLPEEVRTAPHMAQAVLERWDVKNFCTMLWLQKLASHWRNLLADFHRFPMLSQLLDSQVLRAAAREACRQTCAYASRKLEVVRALTRKKRGGNG